MLLVGARRLVLALLVGAILSPGVQAQGPTRASLRQGVTRPLPADTLPRAAVRLGGAGGRAVASVLGSVLGISGGVALATNLLPRRECGDDPGFCEAIAGYALGSIVGAGFGAALGRGNGACGFRRRLLRGEVGAVIGFAAGFGLSVMADDDGLSGLLLGGPLGAVVGATAATSSCIGWSERPLHT